METIDTRTIDIQSCWDCDFTFADIFPYIFAALFLCLLLRLLNRWNRKKAFCYQYPTLMLIAVLIGGALMGRYIDSMMLRLMGFFLMGLNIPVLMVVDSFRKLLGCNLDRFPGWVSIANAGVLFWLAWHLPLRFMRLHSIAKIPIVLNLHAQILPGRAAYSYSNHS
jgi:hypothetical protein